MEENSLSLSTSNLEFFRSCLSKIVAGWHEGKHPAAAYGLMIILGGKATKQVSIVRSGCVVGQIRSEVKPVVNGHLATKKSDFLVAMWWRVDRLLTTK